MKQFCNKCEGERLVFETYQYFGEYATHDFVCLDCKDQGTMYYDIKYHTHQNYTKNDELKVHYTKEKT